MSLTKVSYSMITGAPVNVFDFFSAAQKADVLAGTATIDCAPEIQTAMTYAWQNKIELYDKSISVMHKITRGCVTNSGMRHRLLALRFTCINLENLKALANVI